MTQMRLYDCHHVKMMPIYLCSIVHNTLAISFVDILLFCVYVERLAVRLLFCMYVERLAVRLLFCMCVKRLAVRLLFCMYVERLAVRLLFCMCVKGWLYFFCSVCM